MFKNILQWVDQRFPLSQFMHWSLHEEIPGGASFSYTLGSAALFLLMVQIISGVWQLFYYVPTVDHAYASLTYLRREVPYGWLIHGFHYWGANLFTVVIGLHVLRVFLWGAYKKPRELVWLAGFSLLLLTIGFMFTGPILPWDKNGYWAGVVGLSILGNIPLVGHWMQAIMQGQPYLGQSALSRIFIMHVAFLPALAMLMVTIHLVAFRKFGSTGPWKEEKRKTKGLFWPDQIWRDLLITLLLLLLLIGLTAFSPPPYTGMADPQDTVFSPKPEWPFFFIYESIKMFHVSERLITAGIPLVIILLFVSLPFLDRSPERNPAKRIFIVSCGLIFVLWVLALTWKGFSNKDTGAVRGQGSFGEMATPVAPPGISGNAFTQQMQHKVNIGQGRYMFFKYCSECHTVEGKPSNLQGPDLVLALTPALSRDWLKKQVTDPQAHNRYTTMPAFNYFSKQDLDSMLDFLQSLEVSKPQSMPGRQAAAVGKPVPVSAETEPGYRKGERLFKKLGCMGCHTVDGRPINTRGPDLLLALGTRSPTRQWLEEQIKEPAKHFPNSTMPSFSYLKEDQLSLLVKYLQGLSRQRQGMPQKKLPAPPKGPARVAQATIITGQAIHIVGDKEHGKILYQQYCMSCHGPHGNIQAKHFHAPPGVPGLGPVRPTLYNQDPDEFVRNLDPYIQQGGHNPKKGPDMPAFGKQAILTQPQIADVEAYLTEINGVKRSQITRPGIKPAAFFYIVLEVAGILGVLFFIFVWVTHHLQKDSKKEN